MDTFYTSLVTASVLKFKAFDFLHYNTIQNLVQNKMIILDKDLTMGGHQYTPEQRNCIAMAYERNKENFKFMNIIKDELSKCS